MMALRYERYGYGYDSISCAKFSDELLRYQIGTIHEMDDMADDDMVPGNKGFRIWRMRE